MASVTETARRGELCSVFQFPRVQLLLFDHMCLGRATGRWEHVVEEAVLLMVSRKRGEGRRERGERKEREKRV